MRDWASEYIIVRAIFRISAIYAISCQWSEKEQLNLRSKKISFWFSALAVAKTECFNFFIHIASLVSKFVEAHNTSSGLIEFDMFIGWFLCWIYQGDTAGEDVDQQPNFVRRIFSEVLKSTCEKHGSPEWYGYLTYWELVEDSLRSWAEMNR